MDTRPLLHIARRDKMRSDPAVMTLLKQEFDLDEAAQMMGHPDTRLKLLFVCAHPAIDDNIRMPLMLQIVLGFAGKDIAPAMLTSPASLAQRVVRATQKNQRHWTAL